MLLSGGATTSFDLGYTVFSAALVVVWVLMLPPARCLRPQPPAAMRAAKSPPPGQPVLITNLACYDLTADLGPPEEPT
jgi:hypothetical protein